MFYKSGKALSNYFVPFSFVTGSREAGFVYAIASAGVVHAVSRACRVGNLSDCACETKRKRKQQYSGWEWGGCNDDVRHGIAISKMFVDAPEHTARVQSYPLSTAQDRSTRSARAKRGRYLMNLHNNEVGRRVSWEHFYTAHSIGCDAKNINLLF